MKVRSEDLMTDAPFLCSESEDLEAGLGLPELSAAAFEGLGADPFGAIFGDIEPPLIDGGKETGTPTAEQVVTGGVGTPQREGSLRALLLSILMPIESEFPKS